MTSSDIAQKFIENQTDMLGTFTIAVTDRLSL